MRVLIVGDGNHQFIKGLVNNLRNYWDNNTSELLIDVFSDRKITNKDLNLYDDVFYSFSNKTLNVKGIRRFISILILKKRFRQIKKDYDIIHIHFVKNNYVWIQNDLKKKGNRLILSFWGSDFYRATKRNKSRLMGLVKAADKITFANPVMAEKVKEFYQMEEFKIAICKFGLTPLEYLKKINKNDSKKIFNLPSDKIIITIGYNLNKAQQHIGIIKQLENNPFLFNKKENIHFVFPLTYGTDGKYKKELFSTLETFPYSYETLTNYLSDMEIAHLRNATDIFIQLQITDQFSGSMSEHLYAGNIVITGSWLPYDEMKKLGIQFFEIDNLDQLNDSLNYAIENIQTEKLKVKSNKELISRFGFWENNIKDWIKVYSD